MASTERPAQRVVTVTSTGHATAPPDVLDLHLGVEITTDSAQAALRGASAAADGLLRVLAEHGVAGADVATEGLAVHPNHGAHGRPDGYTASNQVRARLRDLGRAGALVDAVVEHVGDGVLLHGLVFGIEDPTQLLSEARRLAVQQALAEAAELAAAAGLALGEVLSISEGGSPSGPPRGMYRLSAMAAAAPAPVEPGERDVQVQVTVEVALA